mgnify:CR=1 FL=1
MLFDYVSSAQHGPDGQLGVSYAPSFFHFSEAVTSMHTLRGAPALSPFRRDKLLARLQERVPGVSAVYAEFMHFAELQEALDEAQLEVIERLVPRFR